MGRYFKDVCTERGSRCGKVDKVREVAWIYSIILF